MKQLPNLNLPTIDNKLPSLEESPSTLPILDDIDEITDDEDFSLTDEYFPEEEQEVVEDISDKILDTFQKEPRDNILEEIEKEPLNELSFSENSDDDKFIDKKKKKIIPIKTKPKDTPKQKSKIRAKDFDGRSNVLAKARFIRIVVILIILGMFGFGIKNTFFVKQPPTPDEIIYYSKQGIRDFDFPLERGEAFSKEFLKHYFKSSYDSNSLYILEHFYSDSIKPKDWNNNNKQRLIIDPILQIAQEVNDNLAWYRYSVLLSDVDGQTINEKEKFTGYWADFLVSVYYENDTLYILKDNPTLVSAQKTDKKHSHLLVESPLGDKLSDELTKQIEPTVDGFIVGYSKSSESDYSEVKQFIIDNPPQHLIKGFGRQFEIARNKNDSIKKKFYITPNKEILVDVTVDWKKTGEIGKIYPSRYVIYLKLTEENVYLVYDFYPYIYQKGD